MKAIPFQRIPHQSNLFLKYIQQSPDILSFFQHPPTLKAISATVSEINASYSRETRHTIAGILQAQAAKSAGDEATSAAIEDFAKPDCIAVVTGQQVGLFSGPLYTVYKALTAIRMAAELRSRGVRAVPIFWMDTEDHDLAEVTRTVVLGRDCRPETVDYRNMLFGDSAPGNLPVGTIRLPETIQAAIRDYLSRMRISDESHAQSLLDSAYRAGRPLAESFAILMYALFQKSGLILFDPHDTEAKRLLSKVFRKATDRAMDIHDELGNRTLALMNAGFHAQVNVQENSTVLFLQDENGRFPILRQGSRFSVKNQDRMLDREELHRIAEDTPEHLSPNVLLRPVVQDTLFPTVAYIAGPSEIAYFAQVAPLYRLLERPMPVIWPRNSLTLLERDVIAAMGGLGIEFEDCFRAREEVVALALQRSGSSKGSEMIGSLHKETDRTFEDIIPDVRSLDASLVDAAETVKRKILHNIESLKNRTVGMEAGRNRSVLEQVNMVVNSCFPNRKLQEREFGILQFLRGRGPSLLEELGAALPIEDFTHQLVPT